MKQPLGRGLLPSLAFLITSITLKIPRGHLDLLPCKLRRRYFFHRHDTANDQRQQRKRTRQELKDNSQSDATSHWIE